MSLYEKFLNLTPQVSVTIFLTNGVKLEGVITSWDEDNLILVRNEISQMVFRYAIATILPREPLKI